MQICQDICPVHLVHAAQSLNSYCIEHNNILQQHPDCVCIFAHCTPPKVLGNASTKFVCKVGMLCHYFNFTVLQHCHNCDMIRKCCKNVVL